MVGAQRLEADAGTFQEDGPRIDHAPQATGYGAAAGKSNAPPAAANLGQNARVLARLTTRKEWQFFAALPAGGRAARRRRGGSCWCCGVRCRPRSPSRWARSSARCSAASSLTVPLAVAGAVFVAAPGADAAAPGGQRQPRRSHGGLALRSAHRGLRASAGHGPPRRSDADRRPDGRARLRSRHDRPAAVDLDGLHRRRPGRDDRRPRLRRRAGRATRGGRRSCSPARGSRRTGCCARAPSGATATPRRCAARSATPTTPIGSPSIRRRARSCGCSAWPGWTIDRFVARRTRLHELQYAATRLRERPVLWSLLLVVGANVVVFWSLATPRQRRRIALGEAGRVRAERGRRRR